MQAAAYGFGEWAWEAMRSDQPESFRSVCTLCACGHISQCMNLGSMKSLWHFLTLFKFSLTIYSLKPSLWSSLSFLHCSCTFKAQASLYSLLWHSAFITVTLIWRRRWSAKCNLDLERVDVETNLFNRCHSNFGCFKAWQKARKTVEFFQVLLQIQILRDTQKVLVTLVTFLHTFTHPKVFTDISGLASLHGLLPWRCLGVSQDGRSKKDVIETKQQRSRCLWRKLVKGCCLIIPSCHIVVFVKQVNENWGRMNENW